MRSMLVIVSLMALISGCSTGQTTQTKSNPREYQIGAYLWQQTSGEYRALTYQAYNLARSLMERELENKHNKKRAVIFDIDETVLDNSFGGASDIVEQRPWSDNNFAEWTKLKKAVAIPGAVDFIKFLVENKVEVFYVSNRKVPWFNDTYENLIAQGFPVKKENLMLMSDTTNKEARRQEVQKRYEVVLYVGDNLTDFPGGFEKTSVEVRNALTDKLKADFGSKFIVLPNPLYGDWERALPTDKSRIELLKVTP